jgi:hypothetical protein
MAITTPMSYFSYATDRVETAWSPRGDRVDMVFLRIFY